MHAPKSPQQIPRMCKIVLGNKSFSDSDSDDAIIYLLQEAYSSLDRPTPQSESCSLNSAPSAPSSPSCWKPNWRTCRWSLPSSHRSMTIWRADCSTWDYRTVCLTVWSATLVPLRELCCLLFTTLQTLSTTESGHLKKFSDDTVGRVEGGREDEFRDLSGNFVKWCRENHLQLNVAKTNEMVADFRRNKPRPLWSASVGQMLWIHSKTWVWCWTINWSGLQTWRQSTRRAWAGFTSWGGSGPLMSAVRCSRCFISLLLWAPFSSSVVSWGAAIKVKDANRLNKLIKKAGSVVGSECVILEAEVVEEKEVEDRMLVKLLVIMKKVSQPPQKCGSAKEQLQQLTHSTCCIRLYHIIIY